MCREAGLGSVAPTRPAVSARPLVPARAPEACGPVAAYPEDMGGEEHVCPVCGRPVDTVVRRHKTLGAWVPVWGPGPCHDPDCPSRTPHDDAATGPGDGEGSRPGTTVAKNSGAGRPPTP